MLGGKWTPWEWSHKGRGTNHVRTKDKGTYHVLVNLSLILYKLTGWLASLDLRQGLHLSHPQPLNATRSASKKSRNDEECLQEATKLPFLAFEYNYSECFQVTPVGCRGCCCIWLPLRPTTRLLGSQPFTLVQKDRPVFSCSWRFCRVHHFLGRALVRLDSGATGLDWARGDGRSLLYMGIPCTRHFCVFAGVFLWIWVPTNMQNSSAGASPVVFPHWLCRLMTCCHALDCWLPWQSPSQPGLL